MILALDRLGMLSAERGWIHWRKKKSTLAEGPAQQEFEATLRSSVRHNQPLVNEGAQAADATADGSSNRV